jgi:hypothetical protein
MASLSNHFGIESRSELSFILLIRARIGASQVGVVILPRRGSWPDLSACQNFPSTSARSLDEPSLLWIIWSSTSMIMIAPLALMRSLIATQKSGIKTYDLELNL